MVIGNGHRGKKRNHGGISGHGGGMKTKVSKMDKEISIRIEKGRIQDVNLVSSGRNRLGSSETKVISKSPSGLI